MGNTQSEVPKEGQGHPEEFYRGVHAAKSNRYAISELNFVQALQRHPGRAFWEQLMHAISCADRREDNAAAQGDDCGTASMTESARDSLWAEFGAVRAERRRLKSTSFPPELNLSASTTSGKRSSSETNTTWSVTRSDGAHLKLGAGGRQLYSPGAVEVHLPLNDRLPPILDYYRLMADIALAYLDLLPTARRPEKVTGFAARYCLFGITHTQALLHCLTLWKEETFGDGLGFVDYERRRRQNPFSGGEPDSQEREPKEGQPDKDSKGCCGQPLRSAPRDFTLALAEQHCRYYSASFAISYSFLLTELMSATADLKQKRLLRANALDHLDVAFRVTWEIAEDYPLTFLGKLIFHNVPPASSSCDRPITWHGGSSCISRLKLLSLGKDPHRFASVGEGDWSPLQRGLLPLSAARHVRLCIPQTVTRRAQARLLSPAQRSSYRYITGCMEARVLVVPGCSLYVLERSLPSFVPRRGSTLNQTEMVLSEKSTARYPGSTGVGEIPFGAAARGPPPMSSPAKDAEAEQAAQAAKEKTRAKVSGRNMNTDLDLSDERTLVMLCQEESALVSLGAMMLIRRLRGMVGDVTGKQLREAALERLTTGLHGPDSIEVDMLALLLRRCSA